MFYSCLIMRYFDVLLLQICIVIRNIDVLIVSVSNNVKISCFELQSLSLMLSLLKRRLGN